MRLKDIALCLCFSSWCLWNVVSSQLDPNGEHVCTKIEEYNVTTTRQRKVSRVKTTYYCSYFFGRRKVSRFVYTYFCLSGEIVRTNVYSTEDYQTYRTARRSVISCCDGYLQQGSSCPNPECEDGCLFGNCTSPGKCTCEDFYTGPSCTIYQCEVDVGKRVICGHSSVTHDECTNNGCCWSTLEPGSSSPKCFYPKETNPCLKDNGGCEQICDYQNGNLTCGCHLGYQVSANNPKKCEDINECETTPNLCRCELSVSTCIASCSNSEGSYNCLCSPGWEIKELEGNVCHDINECGKDNGGCSEICDNTPGSYQCLCPPGLQLGADKKTCNDINECNINNGGCEYQCNNSFGSFQCSCKPGFILDGNGRTCSDHDECNGETHGCQQKCENFHGSYRCGCNQGYELNADNITCTDINECQEKRTGSDKTIADCHHGCTNTIGSFNCTCNAGYMLLADQKTCTDIDECLAGTSLCQQGCINTLGSYTCKCSEGYKQRTDLYTCEAEPCGNLSAIENGQASCLSGLTGDHCTFTCKEGFTLQGSGTRWCQPNHNWNGTEAQCKKSKCPNLLPPDFGVVRMPCMEYYNSTCQVECMNGYSLNGSSHRKCIIGLNGEMEWDNKDVSCLVNTPCHPNPCQNGGICLLRNSEQDPSAKNDSVEFSHCDCTWTGHTGDRCEVWSVIIPQIFAVSPGITSERFRISAIPQAELNITFSTNNRNIFITPSTLQIKSPSTFAEFQILATEKGVYQIFITLSGESAKDFIAPKTTYVIVKDGIGHRKELPFDGNGVFRSGCFQHKSNTGEVFVSSMEFNNGSTSGIVQWKHGNGQLFPLSFSGGIIDEFGFTASSVSDMLVNISSSQQGEANISRNSISSCFKSKVVDSYVKEALEINSFKTTIIELFNQNSPNWIKLFSSLKDETSESWFDSDFEAKIIKASEFLSDSCRHAVLYQPNGFYYLYKTNQTFRISLPTGHIDLTGNSMKCFVKDLKLSATYFTVIFDSLVDVPDALKPLNGFMETKVNKITFFASTVMDNFNRVVFSGENELNIVQDDVEMKMKLKGQFTWKAVTLWNIKGNKSFVPNMEMPIGRGSINLKFHKPMGSVDVNVEGIIRRFVLTRNQNRKGHCRSNTTLVKTDLVVLSSNVLPNTHSLIYKKFKVLSFASQIETEELPPTIKLPSVDYTKFLMLQRKLQEEIHTRIAANQTTHSWIQELQVHVNNLIAMNQDLLMSHFTETSKLSDKVHYGVKLRENLEELFHRLQLIEMAGLLADFKTSFQQELEKIKTYTGKLRGTVNAVDGFLKIPNPKKNVAVIYQRGNGNICLSGQHCLQATNLLLHGAKGLACYLNDRRYLWDESHTEGALYSYIGRHFNIMNVLMSQVSEPVKIPIITPNATVRFDTLGVIFYDRQFGGWSEIRQKNLLVGGIRQRNIDIPFGEPTNITFNAYLNGSRKDSNVSFYGVLSKNGVLAARINVQLKKKLVDEKLRLTLQQFSLLGNLERSGDLSEKLLFFSTKKKMHIAKIRDIIGNITNEIERVELILRNYTTQLNDSLSLNNADDFEMGCINMFCTLDTIPGLKFEACSKRITKQPEVECKVTQKVAKYVDALEAIKNISIVQKQRKKSCSIMFPEMFGFTGLVKNYQNKNGGWDIDVPYTKSCNYKDIQVLSEIQVNSTTRTLAEYDEASLRCKKLLPTGSFKQEFLDECITLLHGTATVENANTCPNVPKYCTSSTVYGNSTIDLITFRIREVSFYLKLLRTRKKLLIQQSENLDSSRSVLEYYRNMSHKNMDEATHADKMAIVNTRIGLIEKHMIGITEVENITFKGVTYLGLTDPRVLTLFTTIKLDNGTNVNVVTAYDILNPDAGINDVTEAIVKELLSNNQIKESEIDIEHIQLIQNQEKCTSFEEALHFLGSFIASFKNNVDIHVSELNEIKRTANKSDSILSDFSDKNKLLLHSVSDVAFAYSDVFFLIHTEIGEQNLVVSTWEERLFRFLIHQEYLVSSKNLSNCFTIHGCVEYYAKIIESLVNVERVHSTENLANITKTLKLLTSNLSLLVDEKLNSFFAAREISYATYKALEDITVYIRSICGSKPVLKTTIDGTSNHGEAETLELNVPELEEQDGVITVRWIRDGIVIPNATNFTYLINNLQIKDSGWYSCQVINRFGTTDCGVRKVSVFKEPVITSRPETLILHQNTPVKTYLFCNTSNTAEITWWFQPTNQPHVSLLRKKGDVDTSSVFELQNSGMENSGIYWCKASNPMYTTVSEKTSVTILPVSMAFPRLKLSMKITSNSSRRKRSVSSGNDVLKAKLSKMMNVDQSQIQNLTKNRQEQSIGISLVLTGAYRSQFYARRWEVYAEEARIIRLDLLKKVASFYEKSASTSNEATLVMDGQTYIVDRASMESLPSSPGCPDGYVILENRFMCGACQPGTRYSLGKCQQCDMGFYQPYPAESECRECPYGKTTSATGAKSIDQCSRKQTTLPPPSTTTTLSTTTTTTSSSSSTATKPTISNPTVKSTTNPAKRTKPVTTQGTTKNSRPSKVTGSPSTTDSSNASSAGKSGQGSEEEDGSSKSSLIIGMVVLAILLIAAIIVFVVYRKRKSSQQEIKQELHPNERNIAGHDNPMFNELNMEAGPNGTKDAETRFDEGESHRNEPMAFTNVLYDQGLNIAKARREDDLDTKKKENFSYQKFGEDV